MRQTISIAFLTLLAACTSASLPPGAASPSPRQSLAARETGSPSPTESASASTGDDWWALTLESAIDQGLAEPGIGYDGYRRWDVVLGMENVSGTALALPRDDNYGGSMAPYSGDTRAGSCAGEGGYGGLFASNALWEPNRGQPPRPEELPFPPGTRYQIFGVCWIAQNATDPRLRVSCSRSTASQPDEYLDCSTDLRLSTPSEWREVPFASPPTSAVRLPFDWTFEEVDVTLTSAQTHPTLDCDPGCVDPEPAALACARGFGGDLSGRFPTALTLTATAANRSLHPASSLAGSILVVLSANGFSLGRWSSDDESYVGPGETASFTVEFCIADPTTAVLVAFLDDGAAWHPQLIRLAE